MEPCLLEEEMKIVRNILAVLAVAVFMTASVAAQSKGEGAAVGVIKNDAGEPVAGAQVNFLLPNGGVLKGVSDETGKWQVTGLGKGEWRAMFVAKGFATQVIKVNIKSEDTPVNLPVVLKKGAEE
jgi:hypothetical protein